MITSDIPDVGWREDAVLGPVFRVYPSPLPPPLSLLLLLLLLAGHASALLVHSTPPRRRRPLPIIPGLTTGGVYGTSRRTYFLALLALPVSPER
jgi:hypothetical protein